MESLVDVITTVFEAILGVCVIYAAGYFHNSKYDNGVGTTLRGVSRTILLPALVFVTFVTSTNLTWTRLLQLWPTIVIVRSAHLPSIIFGLACHRFGSAPTWLTETLIYNNVSAYPLLVVQLLGYLSSSETALGHLKWRVMDTLPHILERAKEYILVNLVVTELARVVAPAVQEPGLSNGRDDDSDSEADVPTESTPLVPSSTESRSTTVKQAAVRLSPLLIAAGLGLIIGLFKPIQHALIGHDVRNGDHTGSWRSIGFALTILGSSFALIDLLADGMNVKAAEKKSDEVDAPPSLGTTLVVVFWRFMAVPAIVLAIVYGLRKIPSTKYCLQDPVFSFVLVLVSVTPPALPATLDPYRASVQLATFYSSLLTALPLAIGLMISGRGISRSIDFDLGEALKKAAGGGLAGAMAMVLQVLTLMPLRTIMNYQYRYGGSLKDSVRNLYHDGGFKRYYAGLGAALFQGPLARFGDTAANAGILALLASFTWPVLIKTLAASLASATFRMTLTPIDTLKTTQQTRGGRAGLKLLRERIKENGIQCLWWGALATAAATFVGHYPWFGTYNWLNSTLPIPEPNHTFQKLLRQAFIGFAASVASDTISNSLRVVKTYRQVHEKDVGYFAAAREIIASEGLLALFGRGLPVRLMTNGLQGILFSILWRLFTDIIEGNKS